MNTQEFEHGILYQGNCIEIMTKLPEQSVDAILTDLPYGSTKCAWDVVIPFEPMWGAVKHVLKPNGAFVTTANQPFTSLLVCSNLKWFRYEWIWNKVCATGHLNATRMPMLKHEHIVVFGQNGLPLYHPQKTKRSFSDKKRLGDRIKTQSGKQFENKGVYGKSIEGYSSMYSLDTISPTSIVVFDSGNGHVKKHQTHPTQKPVALYKYLVQTYTNPGDTVLDMCMGSGTTMIACMDLGREWIGIENDSEIFETACERIHAHNQQLPMFPPPLEKRNTDAKQLNLV